MQRPRCISARERGIRRRGVFERSLGLQRDEAVEHGLQALRAGDGGLHHLESRKFPGGKRAREGSEAHRVDFVTHVDVR